MELLLIALGLGAVVPALAAAHWWLRRRLERELRERQLRRGPEALQRARLELLKQLKQRVLDLREWERLEQEQRRREPVSLRVLKAVGLQMRQELPPPSVKHPMPDERPTKVDVVAAARYAATSPRVDPDVRFLVYHPKEITATRWDTLLVYAYIPDLLERVQEDAEARLERPEGHGQRPGRATRSIARGAEVLVVPDFPGCQFNPPADRFLWIEDMHRREFRLRADPQAPGYAPGTAVNGRVTFYVARIVLVAEVTVRAFIADEAIDATGAPAKPWPPSRGVAPLSFAGMSDVPRAQFTGPRVAWADPYGVIFVSYAHEDVAIVTRLGMAYKVLGMKFLRDQEVLRSGEKWHPRLLDLIQQADIFQLYWSRNAERSRYVRQEWRHALLDQRKRFRDNFIRPVYWQKPMPKPPAELAHLHFAYLPLDELEPARPSAPS